MVAQALPGSEPETNLSCLWGQAVVARRAFLLKGQSSGCQAMHQADLRVLGRAEQQRGRCRWYAAALNGMGCSLVSHLADRASEVTRLHTLQEQFHSTLFLPSTACSCFQMNPWSLIRCPVCITAYPLL
jgi:hypothetical protein